MNSIEISADVYDMIEKKALGLFVSDSRILPNGNFIVQVDDDVIKYVIKNSLAGENNSDTLRRLLEGTLQ